MDPTTFHVAYMRYISFTFYRVYLSFQIKLSNLIQVQNFLKSQSKSKTHEYWENKVWKERDLSPNSSPDQIHAGRCDYHHCGKPNVEILKSYDFHGSVQTRVISDMKLCLHGSTSFPNTKNLGTGSFRTTLLWTKSSPPYIKKKLYNLVQLSTILSLSSRKIAFPRNIYFPHSESERTGEKKKGWFYSWMAVKKSWLGLYSGDHGCIRIRKLGLGLNLIYVIQLLHLRSP